MESLHDESLHANRFDNPQMVSDLARKIAGQWRNQGCFYGDLLKPLAQVQLNARRDLGSRTRSPQILDPRGRFVKQKT
jgi:hypothetical protein